MINDDTIKTINKHIRNKQKSDMDLANIEDTQNAVTKRHRNRPDLANYGYENAKPGDNARYLRNALVSLNIPPIDVADPEQVDARIRQYFDWCIQNDQKPKVSGMANWLGVDRSTLNTWKNGEYRGKTHSNIIKKYYGILEELWETYMQDGTINTVSGIFLGKVMFDYRETSEVVITPNNPYESGNVSDVDQIVKALPDVTDE